MPRRNMYTPPEDAIQKHAPLIRELLSHGEAYLGIWPRAKTNGLRARLTHLRSWSYDQTVRDQDPDHRAARVFTVLRGIEIDTEPAPSQPGEKLVHVYWRPDPIMAARAKAGYPVPELSDDEKVWHDEAKKWLLEHL